VEEQSLLVKNKALNEQMMARGKSIIDKPIDNNNIKSDNNNNNRLSLATLKYLLYLIQIFSNAIF